ncbi:MAG TPA: MoaD/ThiS family protein [Actinomycetota bacterium]|nr:MoaD/ThiS family protein [Actinomycetota bacterium]
MQVHVTLRGTLTDRLPGGKGTLDVADGATVATVSERLGLPGGHCVFVLNGATVKLGAELREGDRLQAFPPMAGG